MQFEPTNGVGLKPEDARRLNGIFNEIISQTGDLKNEEIVRRAAPRNSPLHPYFTWDDTEAARKQRLHEAASLVRRVRYVIIDSPQEPKPTGAMYVRVTDEESGEKVRRAMPQVVDSEVWMRELLQEAWRTLLAWRKKYEGLRALEGIRTAINSAAAEVERAMQPQPGPRRRRRSSTSR